MVFVEMAELFAQHLQIPQTEQSDFMRRARGEFVARFGLPKEMSLVEAQTDASDDEAPKHNLPSQTTTFVGREHELRQISLQLANPACRLLTILGPGGMGKSRLSLEAARAEIGNFTDGVLLIPLAKVSSADHDDQESHLKSHFRMTIAFVKLWVIRKSIWVGAGFKPAPTINTHPKTFS